MSRFRNPAVVQAIVDKAEIRSSDVVFEIGPGTGNLTVELLKRAKRVVCVEFDRRMVREVRSSGHDRISDICLYRLHECLIRF